MQKFTLLNRFLLSLVVIVLSLFIWPANQASANGGCARATWALQTVVVNTFAIEISGGRGFEAFGPLGRITFVDPALPPQAGRYPNALTISIPAGDGAGHWGGVTVQLRGLTNPIHAHRARNVPATDSCLYGTAQVYNLSNWNPAISQAGNRNLVFSGRLPRNNAGGSYFVFGRKDIHYELVFRGRTWVLFLRGMPYSAERNPSPISNKSDELFIHGWITDIR